MGSFPESILIFFGLVQDSLVFKGKKNANLSVDRKENRTNSFRVKI